MNDDLIKKIMEIIQLPGEDYTDGQCMDLIIEAIEEAGYDFNWKIFHEEKAKYVGRKVLPLSKNKG